MIPRRARPALPLALAAGLALAPQLAAAQPDDNTPAPPSPSPTPTRTLTLDEAVQTAQKHQPTLRQARAQTEAAAARVDQARSGYLPQVTFTGSYLKTTGNLQPRPGVITAPTSTTTTGTGTGTSPPPPPPPPITGNLYDSFSFSLVGTQLIYDFGQTRWKWRSAESSMDAQHAMERTTTNQVVLQVQTAYFSARAQKGLVRVAQDTLGNQQKHLGQTEGFVKAGTQPEIALAQARTDLANSRVALINAQNAYETSKAQLNQQMGVSGDTDYDVADDETGPVEGEDLPTNALVEKAIQGRPEIPVLMHQRDAQEQTIRAVEGAFGPTLSATSTASEIGVNLGGLVPQWNVGLVLTWPIYQGGLTKGQLREQRANLEVIDAQLEAIKLQIRLDVDQARLAVRAAKGAIGASEDALTNARAQLRLAEGRYSSGVGSIIELGDAQVALTNAAAQLVQSQFNLATARAQLLTALGRRS